MPRPYKPRNKQEIKYNSEIEKYAKYLEYHN